MRRPTSTPSPPIPPLSQPIIPHLPLTTLLLRLSSGAPSRQKSLQPQSIKWAHNLEGGIPMIMVANNQKIILIAWAGDQRSMFARPWTARAVQTPRATGCMLEMGFRRLLHWRSLRYRWRIVSRGRRSVIRWSRYFLVRLWIRKCMVRRGRVKIVNLYFQQRNRCKISKK